MSVKSKIKSFMALSNVSAKELAPALGTAERTAINRLSIGITKIDDLIKIVDYCGGKLTITAKDGTEIPLTLQDTRENNS